MILGRTRSETARLLDDEDLEEINLSTGSFNDQISESVNNAFFPGDDDDESSGDEDSREYADDEMSVNRQHEKIVGMTLRECLAEANPINLHFSLSCDVDSVEAFCPTAVDLALLMPNATGFLNPLTRRTRSSSGSRGTICSGLCGLYSYVSGVPLKNIPLGSVPNMTIMCFQNGPFDLYVNFYYLGRISLAKRSFFTTEQYMVINAAMNIAKFHVGYLITDDEREEWGLCTFEDYEKKMERMPSIERPPGREFGQRAHMGKGVAQMFIIAFGQALKLMAEPEDDDTYHARYESLDFSDPVYTGVLGMADPPVVSKDQLSLTALQLYENCTYTALTAGTKDNFSRDTPTAGDKLFYEYSLQLDSNFRSINRLSRDMTKMSKYAIQLAKKKFDLSSTNSSLMFDVGFEFRSLTNGRCLFIDSDNMKSTLRDLARNQAVVMNSQYFASMLDEDDMEELVNNEVDVFDFNENDPNGEPDPLGSLSSIFSLWAKMQANIYEIYSTKNLFINMHTGPVRMVPMRASAGGTPGIKLSPARSGRGILGLQAYIPALKALLGVQSPHSKNALLSRMPSLLQVVLSPRSFCYASRTSAQQGLRKCLNSFRILRAQFEQGLLFRRQGARFEFFVEVKERGLPTIPEIPVLDILSLVNFSVLKDVVTDLVDDWLNPLLHTFDQQGTVEPSVLTAETKSALYARSELLCNFFDACVFKGPFMKKLKPYLPRVSLYYIPSQLQVEIPDRDKEITTLTSGLDRMMIPSGILRWRANPREAPNADEDKREGALVSHMLPGLSKLVRLPKDYCKAELRARQLFMSYTALNCEVHRLENDDSVEADEVEAPEVDDIAIPKEFGLFSEPDVKKLADLQESYRYSLIRDLCKDLASMYHREMHHQLIEKDSRLTRSQKKAIPPLSFPATDLELMELVQAHPELDPILRLATDNPDTAKNSERKGIRTVGRYPADFTCLSDAETIAQAIMMDH